MSGALLKTCGGNPHTKNPVEISKKFSSLHLISFSKTGFHDGLNGSSSLSSFTHTSQSRVVEEAFLSSWNSSWFLWKFQRKNMEVEILEVLQEVTPRKVIDKIDCSKFPKFSGHGTCHQKPGCSNELRALGMSDRLCDGVVDCMDSSDETNCDYCKPGQFICGDRQCVDKDRRCDLREDCLNGWMRGTACLLAQVTGEPRRVTTLTVVPDFYCTPILVKMLVSALIISLQSPGNSKGCNSSKSRRFNLFGSQF
ncbi:atrial natriuretic peptide-converting enzyme [Caerostris extrusa]|uniref:Atrial natriuretic peptide-converting enzyme n=1 Tax=Caerostris extrusa TaxID=172846 RepID=A0AAV4PFQ2_CAEEX|nr:atrial natriuretic peptide-converting enzyme [Caerostris extrusa]